MGLQMKLPLKRGEVLEAVMNAESIRSLRILQARKNRKRAIAKQAKVSGIRTKRSDNEEWRQLKLSERVICYYTRVDTDCSFVFCRIKTLINSKCQGSRTSPRRCQM